MQNNAPRKSTTLLEKIMRNWLAPPSKNDWVLEAEWARIQQTPVKAKGLLYGIMITVIVLIIWAGFSPIDEVARGEGKVIPSQQLQILQSYDGGIVEDILVKEGDLIKADDILIKLDPTRFLSNLQEANLNYQATAARVQRLSALTKSKPSIFDKNLMQIDASVMNSERQLYLSNLRELNEQISGFDNRIDQRDQDLKGAKAQLQQSKSTFEIVQKELDVTRPMLSSGAVSEIDILRLDRQLIEIQGDINQTQSLIIRSQSAIDEEHNNKEETRLKMLNRWNEELTEALAKMASLEESQTSLKDVVAQTEIRSPIDGTIQRIMFNTVGGVISPGSQVLEIIPLNDHLIVEAKIQPKDIAFITKNQKAILKFSAYDFSVYGGMKARVSHISADAMTDNKDNTYYLVRLMIEEESGKKALDIIPGMRVQVDVITGKKTILNYLLNPIFKVTSSALTER